MKTALPTLLFAAALAACVDDGPDLGFGEQLAGPEGGGTHGGQGRNTLGSTADGLVGNVGVFVSTGNTGTKNAITTTFAIAPGDGTCVTATYNSITHQCSDPWFDSFTFAAPNSTTFKIVSSKTFQTAVAPVRSVTGYRIQYKVGAGAWTEYCVNSHLAYPIAGEVKTIGTAVGNPSITWACSEYKVVGAAVVKEDVRGTGVLAKAMSWGFVAGVPVTHIGVPTIALTATELQFTAARMGHGDYCYSGASNTLDNTAIGYLDLAIGNSVGQASGQVAASPITVDPTQEYVEAAWSKTNPIAGGADQGHPLCLSKLRWSTLPPGDICTATTTLRDPRLHGDSRFCEDWTYEELANAGAVLVNSSKYNDLGLRVWKNGADNFSTTRGYHNGVQSVGDQPPNALPNFTYQSFLGTAVTITGRDVWNAAYPNAAGTFVELCNATNAAGEHALTIVTNVPAGYTCSTPSDGWIWSTPPAAGIQSSLGLTAIALYRDYNSSTMDYYTNIGSAPLAGYGSRVVLGWILAQRTL